MSVQGGGYTISPPWADPPLPADTPWWADTCTSHLLSRYQHKHDVTQVLLFKSWRRIKVRLHCALASTPKVHWRCTNACIPEGPSPTLSFMVNAAVTVLLAIYLWINCLLFLINQATRSKNGYDVSIDSDAPNQSYVFFLFLNGLV